VVGRSPNLDEKKEKKKHVGTVKKSKSSKKLVLLTKKVMEILKMNPSTTSMYISQKIFNLY